MAKDVSARNEASNFISSVGPDVCLTPMGSSMVPVAYHSVAFFDKIKREAGSVKDNSKVDFELNTRAKFSTGHEPGTGKGIKIPGYKGTAFAKEASQAKWSEGFACVRDGDPAWINRPGYGPQAPKVTTKNVEISYLANLKK